MSPILLIAVIVGNVLEYFDFLLFAHFSSIIVKHFFPQTDPSSQATIALYLFVIGFVARPIGGLIFGTLADQKGRRKSLAASMLWMVLPTFFIGCIPTYQTIGMLAPCLVLLCRILQGISIGGEYANAGIFLMEHITKEKRGFYSGILVSSGSLGSLAALSCVYFVENNTNHEWAWRLPFLFSGVLGLFAYRLRQFITESPAYINYSESLNHKKSLLKNANSFLLKEKAKFLITIGLGASISVLVWIPITYTNFYLTQVRSWTPIEALPLTVLALTNYVISSIFMGYLGDYFGTRKLMKVGAIVTILCIYPLFYCLSIENIATAQIGFTILAAACGATVHAVLIDFFPPEVRCRAISFGFAIGISLGSASPIIAEWLVNLTGNQLSPSFYVICIALIGFLAIQHYNLLIKQET